MDEREELRESSGDMAQLNRMAPRPLPQHQPGSWQAERLRNIAQKSALTRETGDVLRASRAMDQAEEQQAQRLKEFDRLLKRDAWSQARTTAMDAYGVKRDKRRDKIEAEERTYKRKRDAMRDAEKKKEREGKSLDPFQSMKLQSMVTPDSWNRYRETGNIADLKVLRGSKFPAAKIREFRTRLNDEREVLKDLQEKWEVLKVKGIDLWGARTTPEKEAFKRKIIEQQQLVNSISGFYDALLLGGSPPTATGSVGQTAMPQPAPTGMPPAGPAALITQPAPAGPPPTDAQVTAMPQPQPAQPPVAGTQVQPPQQTAIPQAPTPYRADAPPEAGRSGIPGRNIPLKTIRDEKGKVIRQGATISSMTDSDVGKEYTQVRQGTHNNQEGLWVRDEAGSMKFIGVNATGKMGELFDKLAPLASKGADATIEEDIAKGDSAGWRPGWADIPQKPKKAAPAKTAMPQTAPAPQTGPTPPATQGDARVTERYEKVKTLEPGMVAAQMGHTDPKTARKAADQISTAVNKKDYGYLTQETMLGKLPLDEWGKVQKKLTKRRHWKVNVKDELAKEWGRANEFGGTSKMTYEEALRTFLLQGKVQHQRGMIPKRPTEADFQRELVNLDSKNPTVHEMKAWFRDVGNKKLADLEERLGLQTKAIVPKKDKK
jgi:hypothetical protein